MPLTEWPFVFRSVYDDTVHSPVLLIASEVMYHIPSMPEYIMSLPGQGAWHAEIYELVNRAVDMRFSGHEDTQYEMRLNLTAVHISAGELISFNSCWFDVFYLSLFFGVASSMLGQS